MASITDLINEFKEDIDKREKEKKSPKAKYSTDIETYLGSIPSDVRYGWVQPIVDYTILNLGREPTKEELASYTQQYYKSKEGESLFSALKAGRPDTMKSAGLPTQSSEYSPEGLSALIGESERLGEGVGYNAGDKGILEQFKTGAPKTLRGTMKDIRSSPEATYNRASKPSMGRDGMMNMVKEILMRRRMEKEYVRPGNIAEYGNKWQQPGSRFGTTPEGQNKMFGTWAGSFT